MTAFPSFATSAIRGGGRTLQLYATLLLAILAPLVTAAKESTPPRMEISGYGFLGNRELGRLARTLQSEAFKGEHFDATVIEDTALILMSRLKADGFLEPVLEVHITQSDGSEQRVLWKGDIDPLLPRPLTAKEVHFMIQEGLRFYYKRLGIQGLTAVPEEQARSYFMETGILLRRRSSRVFTPQGLGRGLVSLREVLERMGYQQATATATNVQRDERTGAVTVGIHVQEGPKSIVRSVRIETSRGTNGTDEARTEHPAQPYSQLWAQDFTQALKATNYHLGYPDTAVSLETLAREEVNGVFLNLLARVTTGPLVRVGEVRFTGEEKTSESLLARRIPLAPGDLLDPTKAEEGRVRLARLGVFESVRLRYDVVDPHTRNVIYDLKEAKSFEANLLLGYGSYELLRGGGEIAYKNVLGLAHHAKLRAIQSFKSTRGEFTYTMPELLGERLDVFLNAFGLRREEVSFTREEYGGGIGLRRSFEAIATDASTRYNYQILKSVDTEADFADEGQQSPAVGAVITDIRHDRRDNPLYPRRGYKLFGAYEIASDYLGGEVSYQRFELAASWHQPLGPGRWLSAGVSHGVLATPGSRTEDLPFSKRFFPGGEHSIRGYQDGEAAPRDAQGNIVGAETYLLGAVEFEQALTPNWSVVFFSDSIGFARELSAYPADESLHSVGGGLRWKTIVGPVRLEYGHNLNPRAGDPSGTLHVSLGFPF